MGVTVMGGPWVDNEDEDFQAAATRAEVRVQLTAPLQAKIRATLRYDRRERGAGGRALQHP
eukprot:12534127-Alexandrium_andersonii.AAC.1